MQVVVPALKDRCPASAALELEGIEHNVVLMEDDYSYSELLISLWQSGDSFTILEHDVVPWPGAVLLLEKCPQKWCGHNYPRAPGVTMGALGCVKFSKELIAGYKKISKAWKDKKWWELDGAVFPTISNSTRVRMFHRHKPDFAHVKGFT